jgi:hypothetical protein
MYEWIISHWKLWGGSALIAGAAKWVKMWFDLRKAHQDLRNSQLEERRLAAETQKLNAENDRLKHEQTVREIVRCMERDEAETERDLRASGKLHGMLSIPDDAWFQHLTSQGREIDDVQEALQIYKSNKTATEARSVALERYRRY